MIEETNNKRGPLGVAADALAQALSRALARVGAPKPDPMQYLPHLMGFVPSLIEVLKPAPAHVDGPMTMQARREFAAEDARLNAEHLAKRAALVADFGPRFIEAGAADEHDATAADSATAP